MDNPNFAIIEDETGEVVARVSASSRAHALQKFSPQVTGKPERELTSHEIVRVCMRYSAQRIW